MMIKATKSGMAQYTTQELRDHVAAMDAKRSKMPASIRRASMPTWANSKSAIVREITAREST